ncbi:MAG: hypothetical protein BHW58_02795 [Azospirillum sp. 51_20]|nr:MAG: hypothetical protein BHW58_02795 [Azospirillum sp. 51_20]
MPVGCGALLKNGARDFLRSGCEDAGFLLKGAVFGVLRSEGAQGFFLRRRWFQEFGGWIWRWPVACGRFGQGRPVNTGFRRTKDERCRGNDQKTFSQTLL